MRPFRKILTTLAGIAIGASSAPAKANDFFEALFGWTQSAPSNPGRVAYAYPAPVDGGLTRKADRPLSLGALQRAEAIAGPIPEPPRSEGFCVRVCDGYYFPLTRSGNASERQSCDNACPGAKMAIYEGTAIESARNYDGERYASLRTAFSFQSKRTQDCSCNRPEQAEATALHILRDDPTLQSGDIVFKERGAFVFHGSRMYPAERSNLLSSRIKTQIRAQLAAAQSRSATVSRTEQPTRIAMGEMQEGRSGLNGRSLQPFLPPLRQALANR
jgi:hypothetical protein